MRCGAADRVPLFEEDIRSEVLEVWRRQGLPQHADLFSIFSIDRHERAEPDLEPRPEPAAWPSSISELESFRHLLDPEDSGRFPEDWPACVLRWRSRDYPLMLRVCHGLFLSLGVDGWQTFADVAHRLVCEPQVALGTMRIQGEFAARLCEKVLEEVEVDAAVFVEPLCDNHGPLVSPRMYEEFALRSYQPILEVLHRQGIETIIFRTFANARLLLPSVLRYGFNCLWASEVNMKAMDYRDLRREFGRDLRLIGGIDLDRVRESGDAIRREILEKVPPLLKDGGYLPLADGRIREDMPYNNYVYYRRLLEDITRSQ